MLIAFLILLGCELVGEFLRAALHLPIPGQVIGMLVLAIALAARQYKDDRKEVPSPLDRTAGALLDYMGLLFVPAGVGIISEISLLRHAWLPILGGLVGSTVLSLGLTGIVMHHVTRATRFGSARTPARSGTAALS